MHLPWEPTSHTAMRNRTHRAAAELEHRETALPKPEPEVDPAADMMVLIDGAHIRAAHGYQSITAPRRHGRQGRNGWKAVTTLCPSTQRGRVRSGGIMPGASRTGMAAWPRRHSHQRWRSGAAGPCPRCRRRARRLYFGLVAHLHAGPLHRVALRVSMHSDRSAERDWRRSRGALDACGI